MKSQNNVKTLLDYIKIIEENYAAKAPADSDSPLTNAGFRESAEIFSKDDFLNKRDILYKQLADEKDPKNREYLRQELASLEKLYPQYK
jgi:hypothetical protein